MKQKSIVSLDAMGRLCHFCLMSMRWLRAQIGWCVSAGEGACRLAFLNLEDGKKTNNQGGYRDGETL